MVRAAPSQFSRAAGSLSFEGIARFDVTAGRLIRVRPHIDVSTDAIVHYLLGPVIGLALHQRHVLTLHASAVASSAGAILFAGESQWGKSTMAARFMLSGVRPLTDDIAAVSPDEGSHAVAAGPPWLRIWPEGAQGLGIDARSLEPIYPGQEKRRLPFDMAMPEATPIARIYVLVGADRTEVRDLAPTQALIAMIRHSFAVEVLERTESQDWHLEACRALVRAVPIRELHVLADGSAPGSEVVDLVEQDLRRDS